MQDFPCAVHRDTYDNTQIARNESELAQFRADGWMTSAEWYAAMNGETKRKPGRPRKIEGGE